MGLAAHKTIVYPAHTAYILQTLCAISLLNLIGVFMLDFEGEAHEIWAMAQLMPNEGIVDGVDRIKNKLEVLDQQSHNSTIDAIVELFDNYIEDCDVSSNEQQAIQYFVNYVQQHYK